jgi:2-polyprenyl-3-methyl-5-hydroxy-6-metoxy-1,4-benzoquinol methylase
MYSYGSSFQRLAATVPAVAVERIIAAVAAILPVSSLLDVGCARGTWLRLWRRQGVSDITGVDGSYIDPDALEIERDRFVVADLNAPFTLGRRFDLVQCLEVAEHLPAARADSFVADLVAHGPVVLFSAATPGQGGENHVNEQPCAYWQALFLRHDYVAVDCLRPLIARDRGMPPWYRFNLLLYVRRDCLESLAPFVRQFQLAEGEAVVDVAPLLYRLRKAVIRRMPQALCNRLAQANAWQQTIGAAGRGGKPDDRSGSPERFGYSWQHFGELTDDQREQFRRWTALIDPQTGWAGKQILDVGCGAGRNAYWAMSFGAAGGMAIDLDERSLALARTNLSAYPSMTVRFASIYDFDGGERFDIAFSIGVIHHLEQPVVALQRMAAAVKPGGQVLIWVYGRENMELYVRLVDPWRKLLFSRLPTPLVRALAHLPAAVLWCGLRLVPARLDYFRLIRGFGYCHLHHILFDQMLPRIANYWRRDEVLALMTAAGLSDIELAAVNGMSWAALGRKR